MDAYTVEYLANLERKASLFDAIEYAARDLPEGWMIKIEIESGCGAIAVLHPDGEKEHIDSCGRPMAEQITDICAELLKRVHEAETTEP